MAILSPPFPPVSMVFCCLSAGRFVLGLAFTSSKLVITRPVLLLMKIVLWYVASLVFGVGVSWGGKISVVDMSRCKAVRNKKRTYEQVQGVKAPLAHN